MKFLVSHVIQQELHDPRVGFITVLGVEPTVDLREAKVRVSVLGSAAERSKAIHALEDARGYVQRRVGKNLEIRHTPVLRFQLVEPEADAVSRVEAILEKTRKEAQTESDSESATEAGSPPES